MLRSRVRQEGTEGREPLQLCVSYFQLVNESRVPARDPKRRAGPREWAAGIALVAAGVLRVGLGALCSPSVPDRGAGFSLRYKGRKVAQCGEGI